MNRYFPKNKTAFFTTIILLLAISMFLLPCCSKKDQPQQAAKPQETGQMTASEPAESTTPAETEPIEKIDLCILYAGVLESERAKEFTDLLSKHFKKVEVTDYNSFTGNIPVDFDVAVIDYDGVESRAPLPNILRTYTRATVTVGVPGAFICDRQSLKTGYL